MRLLPLIAILLCGCAMPYRAARTKNVVKVFHGRPDGLIMKIEFKDTERGGGIFFMTDPKTQSISASSTNRFSSHIFNMGESSVAVDPQTSEIIKATGAAAGELVGKILSSSVGLP